MINTCANTTRSEPGIIGALGRGRDDSTPLSPEKQDILAGLIAESIVRYGSPSEVDAFGMTFSFKGKVSSETRTVTTGIEFMGDRETYVETDYYLSNLTLEYVFLDDGEPRIRLDTERIREKVNEILEE